MKTMVELTNTEYCFIIYTTGNTHERMRKQLHSLSINTIAKVCIRRETHIKDTKAIA